MKYVVPDKRPAETGFRRAFVMSIFDVMLDVTKYP